MVVFTCGACNETLKKNQVESHYLQRCRQCEVLSCVDCGKDFWGDAYKEHVKCISEEEKYSGKNYVPKANVNKGDKKQTEWLQKVETAIEKTKNSNLKHLLLRLKDYPNIPRKQVKFEKFLRNSLAVYDSKLITEVWNILISEIQKNQEKVVENGHSCDSKAEEADFQVEDEQQKTLNKRERKEERRKNTMKKQKKGKHTNQSEESVGNEAVENKIKKKKKRKHQEMDVEEEEESHQSKKKKKRKHQEVENEDEEEEKHDDTLEPVNCSQMSVEDDESQSKKKQKPKFRWQEVMVQVLKKKGEMPLKRMKKKVIDEFKSQGGFAKSENALSAKFDKKVKKIPLFKVHKDRVKLVE